MPWLLFLCYLKYIGHKSLGGILKHNLYKDKLIFREFTVLEPAILLKMPCTSHVIFSIFIKLFRQFLFVLSKHLPVPATQWIYVTTVMIFQIKISYTKNIFYKSCSFTIATAIVILVCKPSLGYLPKTNWSCQILFPHLEKITSATKVFFFSWPLICN